MAAYTSPLQRAHCLSRLPEHYSSYQGQDSTWVDAWGGIHAGRRDDQAAWWLQESTSVDRQDPRAEH